MTIKIGINGLGRIGRCVLRAIYEENGESGGERAISPRSGASCESQEAFTEAFELVAVNGPAPVETHVHLLKYDSVHGRFASSVEADGEDLKIAGKNVKLLHERDPKNIPWSELGVDIVFECTGKFNKRDQAAAHLESGAKKVLVSAPSAGADSTIVYGVNNDALSGEHQVVTVGSCTTNALAPVVKVLNEAVGIESGFMTTIHAYTGDQNIVDSSHKDLRRARAAAMSMIPTSTGAAKTIGIILPELEGKLDGTAIRVPTSNVSLVDLTFTASNDTSIEQINDAFKAASNGALKGVLGVSDEPLVSIDHLHTPESSNVDLTGTKVMDNRLVRVASWYDNEWAFSLRMLDVARLWTSMK